MNLEQMINELNEYVDNSLTITRYCKKWQLDSYRKASLLSASEGKYVDAETFSEVVKKAYKVMLENKLREMEK